MEAEPVSYISTQDLALRLRIPHDAILRARDAGCPAFKRGRVNIAAFSEWAEKHPESMEPEEGEDGDMEGDNTDGTPLKDQDLKWKIERNKKACRALDLKYESEIGELVPRQQLREALVKSFSPVCVSLEKVLDRPTYNKLVNEIRDALTSVDKATTPDVGKKSAAAITNRELELPAV
jgi:hypothetical protein